jgi:hypothetical protein
MPYVDGSLHFRGDYGLALTAGRSVAIVIAVLKRKPLIGYLRVKAIINLAK